MAILSTRQPPPGFTTDTVNSAQVAKKKQQLPSTPAAGGVVPGAPSPFAGLGLGGGVQHPATPRIPPGVNQGATPPAGDDAGKGKSIGDFLNADYSGDATLQGIINAERDASNQTVSSIDDQIRQLLIQTGLKGVASSQLGADSPYLAAITDDPNGTSIASRLNKGYQTKTHDTDEDLNDQGLFNSGARVGKLGALGHQQVLDQTDLANQLLAALSTLRDAQTAAKTGANKNIAQAEADARDRAIALALQYGIGAGDGSGSGSDTTGGGSDTSGGSSTSATSSLKPKIPPISVPPPPRNLVSQLPAGFLSGLGTGTATPTPAAAPAATPARTTAAAAPPPAAAAPPPAPSILGSYLASIQPPKPVAAVPGQIAPKGKPVYA